MQKKKTYLLFALDIFLILCRRFCLTSVFRYCSSIVDGSFLTFLWIYETCAILSESSHNALLMVAAILGGRVWLSLSKFHNLE